MIQDFALRKQSVACRVKEQVLVSPGMLVNRLTIVI